MYACMCMHDGCVCVCACMHIYSHSIYPFFFKPVYVQYNNTNRFQFRITHMQTTSQPHISFITIIYVLSTSVSLLFCSFFRPQVGCTALTAIPATPLCARNTSSSTTCRCYPSASLPTRRCCDEPGNPPSSAQLGNIHTYLTPCPPQLPFS